MIALYIAAGLFGLGIVVFIHELGHFTAAKFLGIEVEAFALGWGPKIAGFSMGGTDYRICAFPIGGYCKMKGEALLQKKLDGIETTQDEEKGSLFSVPPYKRIITYVLGPLFNFLFAVLLFFIVWMIGTEYRSYDNKVVVLSDYPEVFDSREHYPADEAGLETGDKILAIGNQEINNYRQIQETISKFPQKSLEIHIIRGAREYLLQITPELNKQNGTGFIGVAPYIDPVIETAEPGQPGHMAGLQPGDRIVSVNDQPVAHHIELTSLLLESREAGESARLGIERDGVTESVEIDYSSISGESSLLGVSFESSRYNRIERNPIRAFGKGITDAFEIIGLSVQGIRLMFKGINLKESVSGPMRITYTVGQIAVHGFSQGIRTGLAYFLRFLAFISGALCFMNLLPLPALDGGMIVYNFVEQIRKKPMSVKTFYRFQTIGIIIIGILLFSTLYNDIRYFFF